MNTPLDYKCKQCKTTDLKDFYPLKKTLCKKCRSVKGLKPRQPRKVHQCKSCPEIDPNNFPISSKTLCTQCLAIKNKEKYQFYKNKYNYTGTEEEFKLRQERIKNNSRDYSKIYQKQNRFKYRVKTAKYRALKNNIPFDLTEEFVKDLWDKQEGKCYYSGILMTVETTGRHSISLDRVIPEKGYTQDNVVLCSWVVNTMKNNLTVEEFKIIIGKIYNKMGDHTP